VLARKKAAANIEAQLRKPDFESRLQSFVKTDSVEKGEEPISKMEFWELGEDYVRTPTRPIELLRYLLQRTSKLVGRSQV